MNKMKACILGILVFQCGIILLLGFDFWVQRYSLEGWQALCDVTVNSQNKLKAKLLEVQGAHNVEAQAKLIKRYLDSEQKANHDFLEGATSLYSGIVSSYMALIGLCALELILK